MKLPFYRVDAFTDRVFAGNPAGIVPLEKWLPDELMQRLAAENGLAETAFFVRTGPDRFHLRWFTPAFEIDLCGHATLASAFVLFNHLGQAGDRIVFDSQSGPLMVSRKSGGLLELDFPSRPAAPVAVPPGLARGLGATPRFTAKARDFLCVFDTEVEVRALKPDFAVLAQLDAVGIIVTAPGGDCDFVSPLLRAARRHSGRPGHRFVPHESGSLLGGPARQGRAARPPGLAPRGRTVLRIARRARRPRRPGRALPARRDRNLAPPCYVSREKPPQHLSPIR